MPYYTIINKHTKETREELMSISEMEQFEKDNPDFEILCGAPRVAYSTGTKIKTDNEFKDRLREIKKSHFGSTIDVN
jgi:hypothetical protein